MGSCLVLTKGLVVDSHKDEDDEKQYHCRIGVDNRLLKGVRSSCCLGDYWRVDGEDIPFYLPDSSHTCLHSRPSATKMNAETMRRLRRHDDLGFLSCTSDSQS